MIIVVDCGVNAYVNDPVQSFRFVYGTSASCNPHATLLKRV